MRGFASAAANTVGQFATGAGRILSAPTASAVDTGGVLPFIGHGLTAVGARLTKQAGGIAPTDENAGRNPLSAATGETVGEAAPQFLSGEVAGAAARPVTKLATDVIPALRPQVGPGFAEGTSKIAQAFKKGAAALPGNLMANTALQAVADPAHPVTPVSAGMSLLGAGGEAAGAAGRVGKSPTVRGAPEYFPLSDPDLAAIEKLKTMPDEAARVQAISGEPAATTSARRPANVGIDATKLAQPMSADPSMVHARGALVPTATKLQIARVQQILDANMVTPNPNPAPIADEAFPEGYSTKGTPSTRRPASVAEPTPASASEVAPEVVPAPSAEATVPAQQSENVPTESTPTAATGSIVAPQHGPLRTRAQLDAESAAEPPFTPSTEPAMQGPVRLDVRASQRVGSAGGTTESPETASFGRDLNAPGRIPADAPRIRVPRGTEPHGDIQTPEGAVSVGPRPSPKEIASRAAARVFPPDSPDGRAFLAHLDAAFPEEGRPTSRAISGTEPPIRTQKGKLAANLSTIGDRTLADEYARLHTEHADTEAWIHDKTEVNWPGREDGMDADEGWNQDNSDVHALKREVAQAQRESVPRARELTQLEGELTKRGIDPGEALVRSATGDYPADWDTEAPSGEPSEASPSDAADRSVSHQPADEATVGEGKHTPADRLLNTEKLGLQTPAQDATVQADLERLKSAGLDRERVGLDAQTQTAKRNIADRLKFMLTDADPVKAEKLSGAEIGQLYEHLSNNAAQRTALLAEMAKPGTTAARTQEIGTLIDGLQKDADAMASNIVKGTSQKGRDLNYLRQIAQQSTDPGVWLAQAKRALGDRPLDDDTQSLIVKLANDAKTACAA